MRVQALSYAEWLVINAVVDAMRNGHSLKMNVHAYTNYDELDIEETQAIASDTVWKAVEVTDQFEVTYFPPSPLTVG